MAFLAVVVDQGEVKMKIMAENNGIGIFEFELNILGFLGI
jgi:hypothetical protein